LPFLLIPVSLITAALFRLGALTVLNQVLTIAVTVLVTDDGIAGVADDDLRALIRTRADDTRDYVDQLSPV
jgi:hypothetical protein